MFVFELHRIFNSNKSLCVSSKVKKKSDISALETITKIKFIENKMLIFFILQIIRPIKKKIAVSSKTRTKCLSRKDPSACDDGTAQNVFCKAHTLNRSRSWLSFT